MGVNDGDGADVICLGEMLVDTYCLDGASGRAVALDADGLLLRCCGGAPANFAVGVQRLGFATRLISRVGDDAMGRFLLRRAAEEGLQTGSVRVVPGQKTGISFISIDPNGERTFDFYGAPSADLQIGAHDVRANLPLRGRLLHFGSNTLILDDGLLGTKAAIDSARAQGLRVSCDLNVRLYRWDDSTRMRERLAFAVAHADWLKVAEEELQFVCSLSDIDAAAKDLLSRGPSLVAITSGAAGATVYDRTGAKHWHPTLAKQIVDTTGAGDAFWSGCVASLLVDETALVRALRLGSENAAACIAAVGATTGLLRR